MFRILRANDIHVSLSPNALCHRLAPSGKESIHAELTLHPSQSFLTLLRTFIPRSCCDCGCCASLFDAVLQATSFHGDGRTRDWASVCIVECAAPARSCCVMTRAVGRCREETRSSVRLLKRARIPSWVARTSLRLVCDSVDVLYVVSL